MQTSKSGNCLPSSKPIDIPYKNGVPKREAMTTVHVFKPLELPARANSTLQINGPSLVDFNRP